MGERLPAQSVADIVKTYAQRVGLDPTLFAGLSVRSGFLTSAATCQLTPAQSPPKADSSSNGDVSPTPEAPPSYPLRFHSASLGRLSGDGTGSGPKAFPGNQLSVPAFSWPDCVMRNVQIVDCPDGNYRYAAIDRQTGDFLLRLSDRAALLALCKRLDWVLHEQSKPRKESRAGKPELAEANG